MSQESFPEQEPDAQVSGRIAREQDPARKAELLLDQAESLLHRNPLKTRTLAEQALVLARAAALPQREAQALSLIAGANLKLRESNGVAGPAQESLDLALRIGDTRIAFRAANCLGLNAWRAGDVATALRFLNQSLSAAEQLSDDSAAGRLHSNIGLILREKGELTAALEHHQKALVCYERVANTREIAKTHLNIGATYADFGDWERSVEYFYRALVEDEKQHYAEGMAICYVNVAETYLKRGKYERATQSAELAVRCAEEANSPRHRLMAMGRLGEACFLAGDHLRALSIVEQNIKAAHELNEPVVEAENLRLKAELVMAIQSRGHDAASCPLSTGEAVALLSQALSVIGDAGPQLTRAAIFTTLGRASALNNDAVHAGEYFETARLLVEASSKNYDLARVYFDYGRFLVDQGHRGKGLEMIQEAGRVFKRLDVTHESLAVERYLFQVGAEADSRLSLIKTLTSLVRHSLPLAEFASRATAILKDALDFSEATFYVEWGRPFLLGQACTEKELELCRKGEPAITDAAVCLPLLPGGRNAGGVFLRFAEGVERRGDQGPGIRHPIPDSSFLETISDLLSVAVERCLLQSPTPSPHPSPPAPRYPDFIGQSESLTEVFETIERAAPTNASVLIRGESGTGKELIARIIVQRSPRSKAPLVILNCAALPESLLESELFGVEKGTATGVSGRAGRLELAHQGTLFLDEIGDMSLTVQAKLLRVLQDHQLERVGGRKTIEVDVRIVAATNKNLEVAIADGKFREDLYYRLNVVSIALPPLRDRSDDVPLLLSHFIEKYNEEFQRRIRGVSPEALDFFLDYAWPGNVRELRNIIERAVITCRSDLIELDNLPPALRQQKEPGGSASDLSAVVQQRKQKQAESKAAFEKNVVVAALKGADGNITEAAQKMGVSRMQFYRLLKKYGIKPVNSQQTEANSQ